MARLKQPRDLRDRVAVERGDARGGDGHGDEPRADIREIEIEARFLWAARTDERRESEWKVGVGVQRCAVQADQIDKTALILADDLARDRLTGAARLEHDGCGACGTQPAKYHDQATEARAHTA